MTLKVMTSSMRSDRALGVLWLALGLLGGCGKLTESPGADFAVRITGPSPIPAVGMIRVPVCFEVAGCESFDVSVADRLGAVHPAGFSSVVGNEYVADVPVDWLVGDTCEFVFNDARSPVLVAGELIVTCRDAGRKATTPLKLLYAPAASVHQSGHGWPVTPTQVVAPSTDPLRPYVLGPSLVEPIARLEPLSIGLYGVATDYSVIQAIPLATPRIASTGGTVFISSGCDPAFGCDPIPVSSTTILESGALVCVDQGADWSGVEWGPFPIPAHVVDLVALPDGSLMALSQGQTTGDPTPAAVLTRIVPDPATPRIVNVQIVDYSPRELVQTRFSVRADGTLAYATFVLPPAEGPLHLALRTTDGATITKVLDPIAPAGAAYLPVGDLSASGFVDGQGSVELSPDGTAMLVMSDGGLWLGSIADGSAAQVRAGPYCPSVSGRGGALWFEHSVVTWCGDNLWFGPTLLPFRDWGHLDVFDAEPPHSLTLQYDIHPPGSVPQATARLFGVERVADRMVLTTNTGVRILTLDGKLVGGSDPLPCGFTPTSVAVRSGPTTAAVAAEDFIFVFDVAPAGST